MKAIIEYDLNDSDDTMAHMRAVKALSMACALNDIRQSLRSKDKYGDYSEEVHKAISDIRQEINELIYSHGIVMDELL